MSLSNEWVTPLQRSYQQIKDQLIEKMKLKIPEITDLSEGNIFIVILGIFASIAEVLHYYIDNVARESFFITARRYTSVLKHAKMVDYHVKSANPAMVDVSIIRSDGQPLNINYSIPINTEFISSDGTKFLSTKTIVWEKFTFGVSIPLAQKELRDNITFGTITSGSVLITLGDLDPGIYYVEGSMTLYSMYGDVRTDWELVNTFAYSTYADPHFMVEMDANMKPYIQFGLYSPRVSSVMKGSYYVTKGFNGNIASNGINTAPSSLSSLGELTVNNTYPAVAGTDYESFDMIKQHLPMSIRTLGVAISKEDYEDITKLTPGVDKAYVNYICGKVVDIYITPDGGGIAPQSLIDIAYQNILKKKVITTNINVLPTGVSELYLEISITGKKSFRSQDISNQVVDALLLQFSYNNSDIGKPVRMSDLYALIDNLSMIDFLSIDNLYLKPWASRLTNTVSYLNISYYRVDKIDTKFNFILTYTKNGNRFTLVDSESGVKASDILINTITNVNYLNNTFSIKISNPTSGVYSEGDQWSFYIIPNNKDQEVVDFTIPVITSKDSITLSIKETV